MAKKCFACGEMFKGSTKELLRALKRDKKDYYFYQLEENGDVYIVKASKFSKVLESTIKPNYKNGANYAHISEYNE